MIEKENFFRAGYRLSCNRKEKKWISMEELFYENQSEKISEYIVSSDHVAGDVCNVICCRRI